MTALDELREMVECMIELEVRENDPHAAGALLAVLTCIDALTGRRAPAGTGTVSGYQARQAVFDECPEDITETLLWRVMFGDPPKDTKTCASDAPNEHQTEEDDHGAV